MDHCDFGYYRKSINMGIDIYFLIQYNDFVVVLLKVNCILLSQVFYYYFKEDYKRVFI